MSGENVTIELNDKQVEAVFGPRFDALIAKKFPGISGTMDAKVLGDHLLDNDKRFGYAMQIWKNNGWLDRKEQYGYKYEDRERKRRDLNTLIGAINSSAKRATDAAGDRVLTDLEHPTDATILLPQVFTEVVREAVEPLNVLTSLFRRINFSAGETITFPATSAFGAEDIAPGQEYPERSLRFAGSVTAKIGKSGVAVRFTDEMLRYSMFDVMSLHLQAAGRAMVRHKETKIANQINAQGTTVFDNSGGASLRGGTTGRNAIGVGNSTLTLDDLFVMFADLMNSGFVPNTLLMNPMGWLIFARNETLRSFGFANNGPLWGAMQGTPAMAPTFGGQGGVNMFQSGTNGVSLTPENQSNANMQTPVPTLFPAPLSIVVSPYIPFAEATQDTSIIMCDRNELGILVVDEELVTETWDDPARDISKTKMRERYAIALDNEGDAAVVAKGVSTAKGYNWEDFIVQQNYPGTGLPPIVV